MSTISLVLPVYNEEENLPKLFAELQKLIAKLPNEEVELIFVDDGSHDRSYEILTGFAQQYPFVKTVSFSRNFGHQIAFTAGIDHATGDAVIVLDSDLQDPPEVALQMIEQWRGGAAVIYAKRRKRPEDESWLKKTTAHWYYRILNRLSDIPIPTDTGDFRLMDRKVVEELKRCREHSRYMRGLTSFVGFPQTAIFYDRHERFAGKPKYKLFKQSLKLALDGLTGFSAKPLRLISYIGFVTALLSFLGIIYAIFMKIFFPEITVSGFTLTIIAIFFIGGMQMLILGIIGEYIGRIYIEAQNRPLYIVKHKMNLD
ncbi:glycosyltransferase [Candidatus Uhrbacteria bacterium]|nr:glycosyltransferase [Candidatus Uhrbacteria bacterium]